MSKLAKKHNFITSYIDETGLERTFSDEQIVQYVEIKSQAHKALIDVFKKLAVVKNESLFRLESYRSFKEFVEDIFSFSAKTALNFIEIEEKFSPLKIAHENFPMSYLLEVCKDEKMMKSLEKSKDRDSQLMKFIETLKKQKAMVPKKPQVQASTAMMVPDFSMIRTLHKGYFNYLSKPETWDTSNDDNLRQAYLVIKEWKFMFDAIIHPLNIERMEQLPETEFTEPEPAIKKSDDDLMNGETYPVDDEDESTDSETEGDEAA